MCKCAAAKAMKLITNHRLTVEPWPYGKWRAEYRYKGYVSRVLGDTPEEAVLRLVFLMERDGAPTPEDG